MRAFVNIGSSSMRTESKQPVHERKTSACGFHSSMWLSQQHRASQQLVGITAARVGFTAACGLHSSMRASQQHAGFTAACGLHSSTRASQQHASFTTARKLHNSTQASLLHNSIRLLAIQSSVTGNLIARKYYRCDNIS